MEQENEQKASFGMKLLSFLIPLAGLIIFACNISKRPKYAKGCGIAALIGFIITIVISFVFPIIVSFLILNTAQDALEENGANISAQVVSAFNSKFESYEGEDVNGANVKSLIRIVNNSNMAFEEKQVTLTVDGVKLNSSGNNITINTSKTYEVKMNYDSKGYINKIKVTSNI